MPFLKVNDESPLINTNENLFARSNSLLCFVLMYL